MRWPTRAWGQRKAKQIVPLDDSSLWAGYNMRPTDDDVLADQSVNGYDLARTSGPISLQSILGDAMQFGGVGNWATAAPDDTFTALTIELWWRPRAGVVNSSRILEVGQNDVELITGQLGTAVYVKINNNNAYIQNDGIQTESWHHVVITYTNGVGGSVYIDGELAATSAISNEGNLTAFTDLTIGSDYTNTLNVEGDLLRPCIYSEVKDATWVTNRYREGAIAVQFHTAWGAIETVANATSGYISNTPFRVNTGSWAVETETIEGHETKVLVCKTAGVCYLPTSFFAIDAPEEAAYGTFSFWLYKGADGNRTEVEFISDLFDLSANDGYAFFFYDDERIYVSRRTGGGAVIRLGTSTGYISNKTWYNVRITRDYAGNFTSYLDGSLIVASTGTNPFEDTNHTASNYVVLDFDAGDKIALGGLNNEHAITKYLGVVTP